MHSDRERKRPPTGSSLVRGHLPPEVVGFEPTEPVRWVGYDHDSPRHRAGRLARAVDEHRVEWLHVGGGPVSRKGRVASSDRRSSDGLHALNKTGSCREWPVIPQRQGCDAGARSRREGRPRSGTRRARCRAAVLASPARRRRVRTEPARGAEPAARRRAGSDARRTVTGSEPGEAFRLVCAIVAAAHPAHAVCGRTEGEVHPRGGVGCRPHSVGQAGQVVGGVQPQPGGVRGVGDDGCLVGADRVGQRGRRVLQPLRCG